ncbi:MAG: hypothetical protein ACKVW3_15035 [Phycisphaerales bacterium]
MVAANQKRIPPLPGMSPGNVVYGISNGVSGPNFVDTTRGAYGMLMVPSPPDPGGCSAVQNGVDAVIAVSKLTGKFWLLGQLTGSPTSFSANGFVIADKSSASLTLNASLYAVCDPLYTNWDKPWLAVGRRFGAAPTDPETMFLVNGIATTGCSGAFVMHVTESDWSTSPPSTPGAQWAGLGYPNPRTVQVRDVLSGCERRGSGAVPMILGNGRLVVVYRPPDPTDTLRSPAEFFYLDGPQGFPLSSTVLFTERKQVEFALIPPSTPEGVLPLDSSLLAGISPVPNLPGACADPRTGRDGDAYVSFAGRFASTGTENTDLVVAWLQRNDGQPAQPLEYNFLRTLHLKDSNLGMFNGMHQFMPWVAVDGLGGVNQLFYVRDPNDTLTRLKVCYARLPSFDAAMPSSQLVFVQELTPWFDPNIGVNFHVGDYHMIVAEKCYVYVAYKSTHEGHHQIYVRRINICTGDVDDDSLIGAGDVPAFASAYLTQNPAADLTQDGTVNAWDVATFTEAIACQCNPPIPQP